MSETFSFHSSALVGATQVVRFKGREAVNELYGFDIRLLLPRTEASALLDRVIGERARLTMFAEADRGRVVHGIVTEADLVERFDHERVVAAVHLAPKLARLTLKRASRVFIEKTAREVVSELLERGGVRHRFALRTEPARREMCVQYAETDYELVRRLLAEEGIFTFFEHPVVASEGEEVLVLGDEPGAYAAISGPDELRFRGGEVEGGLAGHEDVVRSFTASRRLRPQAVLQRTFDFTRPHVELGVAQATQGVPRLDGRGTMRALADRELTIADHFGPREQGLLHPHEGKRNLEAERRGSSDAAGESPSRRVLPGAVFKLTEHDVSELDRSYVVTEATHRGFGARFLTKGEPAYRNSFRCEPADMPVRPARPTPRVVQALETATVVGPPGQEVFTDSFGRVKLKFHWDLDDGVDDKRSCWARVGQAWAGAGWGAQFIPRVGSEVLVGFMGGDPDRPVVLGGVYNGVNPIPFANDLAGRVSGIRSRGLGEGSAGHEITWDDRPGAESLSLRAHGLMTAEAEEDMRLAAGGTTMIRTASSRTDEVGDGFTVSIGGAHERMVAKSESASVGGDLHLRVGGERREQVAGACVSLVGDTMLQQVGAARTTFIGAASAGRGSDTLAVNGEYRVSASGGITLLSNESLQLRVGSSAIRIEPERILIEADEVLVQAREKVSAAQGRDGVEASLVLAGSVSVAGGEVFASSGAGAKLHLHADAHLDGALVKLNCGSGAGAGAELIQTGTESGTAVVRLDRGVLEGTGPYTLVMQMPDGTVQDFPIEPGGQVVLSGSPGDKFLIIDLRHGDASVAVRRKDA